jgi:RNA polymerase sigma-70 factor (ECF subfamily)
MEQVEEQGLAKVYSASRAELLRFLVARTGDPAEAEDLLQELWLKARHPGAGPVAHGRAYLYRMAQNLIVDRLRERQRRRRREEAWYGEHTGDGSGSEPSDPSRNAEETLLDREEAAALASAVASLPAAARRAFVLHKVDGLRHAEVADLLGISKSGVEKHMSVAMRHLRRALLD